ESCSLMRRDRPSALRMDVAPLPHRTKPRRDRLCRLIPPQTAVDRHVAVTTLAMTIRPLMIGQIVGSVLEQVRHPLSILLALVARSVERRIGLCVEQIPD